MGEDSSKRYDDLTRIKGIGEGRQKWLRETMNVRTMQDLAALNVENILGVVRAQGIAIPQKKIEEWIQEARAFVEETSLTTKERKAVTEIEWQPNASFVVEIQTHTTSDGTLEYRTSISHVETDKNCQWDGVLPDVARQWMRTQADLTPEAMLPVPTQQPPLIAVPDSSASSLEQPARAAVAPRINTDAERLAKIPPLILGTSTKRVETNHATAPLGNISEVIEKTDQRTGEVSRIGATALLVPSNSVPQSSQTITVFSVSAQGKSSALVFGHENDEKIRQQLARYGLT